MACFKSAAMSRALMHTNCCAIQKCTLLNHRSCLEYLVTLGEKAIQFPYPGDAEQI